MMTRRLLLWLLSHVLLTHSHYQCDAAFLHSFSLRRCDEVFLKNLIPPSKIGRHTEKSSPPSSLTTAKKENIVNEKRQRAGNIQRNGTFKGQGDHSTRTRCVNNTSKKFNVDEKTAVILYYKPKNVITSHSNTDATSKNRNDSYQTVYEDIKSMKGFIEYDNNDSETIKTFEEITGIHSKLHAIGRLDVDTTGLLLLTNDGGLVHHVTNPTASTKIPSVSNKSKRNDQNKDSDKNCNEVQVLKTYEAVIMGYHLPLPQYHDRNEGNGHVNDEENRNNNGNDNDSGAGKSFGNDNILLQLFKGVDIGAKYGGMTKPVHELEVLGHPTDKSTLVRITIAEGKNRQVRRMFHAIGSGVMRLHRCKVGNIDLETMLGSDEGSWRLLSEDEIESGLGWKVRSINDCSHQSPRAQNSSRRRRRRSTGQTRNHKTNRKLKRK